MPSKKPEAKTPKKPVVEKKVEAKKKVAPKTENKTEKKVVAAVQEEQAPRRRPAHAGEAAIRHLQDSLRTNRAPNPR